MRNRAGCVVLFGMVVFGADVVRAADEAPLASVDFESNSLDGWMLTDPDAWRLNHDGDSHVIELFRASEYKPKVRSPLNIAILKEPVVADFQLDVRLKSTVKDYGHRDLCLFFGYVDPSHFYYLHMGKRADPHSNSIFIVNDAPRLSIAKTRTKGTDWDDDWHHVRITRACESGSIKVYFDDMNEPVMTAEDKTFLAGKVGVGSFDDTGVFDDLILHGTLAE